MSTVIKKPKSSKATVLDNTAVEEKLEWVLDAVDRILSPANGMVIVNNADMPAPAFTDGETIWLNKAMLPKLEHGLSNKSLVAWLGFNHHEVGHTLYSPRPNSTLIKGIKELESSGLYQGLRRVENIVEDQREERLVIARFRPWRTYLTAAAMEMVVNGLGPQPAAPIGAIWPWIVGRTWLPSEIRAKSKAGWPGDGSQLAQLVGAYQRLADPGEDDSDEAIQLLVDIRQCLIDGGEQLENLPTGCAIGKITEDLLGDSEPQTLTADDDVIPSAGSDEDDEQLDEAEDASEAGEDDADGDADDGGDTDTGDGDGDEPGEAGDDPDMGGPPTADEADTMPDGNSGAGGPAIDDFVEALEDQINDQINNDPEVKKQVEETRASLEDMTADNQSGLEPDDSGYGAMGAMDLATAEAQFLGRNVGMALRRLTDLALPSWVRRVGSGKLNVGRFMNRTVEDGFDTMFDKFEQGHQEEVSLDVTILVDTSSSMNDHAGHGKTLADQAAEAVFAIAKGTDEAEGDCTIIEFNDASHLISQTGTIPSLTHQHHLRGRGGTDPTQAIMDTYVRLRSVEAYHQVVIVVTDGEWHRGGDVMADLAETDVVTMAVQLDPRHGSITDPEATANRRITKTRQAERMGCEYNITVADCRDMVPLFEEVVVSEMEKAMEIGGMR